MWNFFSCGFFAHAHAQDYALTMRGDLFAIAASIVSDEHNHAIHHMFPHWAYHPSISARMLPTTTGDQNPGLTEETRD